MSWRSNEKHQFIIFHKKIIKATGGSDGIRDINLIDSALNKAYLTFDGQDLYDGFYKKVSVITYALTKNHRFVDGNNRIGVAIMMLLLKLNGYTLKYTQAELVKLGLGIAKGKYSEEDIEQWILRQHV